MFRHPSVVLLVTAGLLLLAVFPLPYGFYAFLRVVVFLTAASAAFVEWDSKKEITGWAWVWICIALLFNPLVPIHLNRLAWFIFDVGAAGAMVLYWKQISEHLKITDEKRT